MAIAHQSCKQADKYRPEPENISPDPKRDLKPKVGPKIKLDLKNYLVIARIRLK